MKNENYRLQAALRNVVCPNCGGPAVLGEMGFDEQAVRLENARLKEEVFFSILYLLHFKLVFSLRQIGVCFIDRNAVSILSICIQFRA